MTRRLAAVLTTVFISLFLVAAMAGCSGIKIKPMSEQSVREAATEAGVSREEVAVVVDGTVITQAQIDTAVADYRARRGLADNTAYTQYLKSAGMTDWDFRKRVILMKIDEVLIRHAADDMGITVDDKQIDQYIYDVMSRYPSTQAWINALTERGYTETSYREALVVSMISNMLAKAVLDEVVLTDQQITEYASVVAPSLVGKRSSHILFASNDYALASEVRRSIVEDGADFAEMARRYSVDGSAAEGGDMGWDSLTALDSVYQEELDRLEVGEVSPVFRSSCGLHIVVCTDVYTAPLLADGSIDISAIPYDLMESIKGEMADDLFAEMWENYLVGLENECLMAVFDKSGKQVSLLEIGIGVL